MSEWTINPIDRRLWGLHDCVSDSRDVPKSEALKIYMRKNQTPTNVRSKRLTDLSFGKKLHEKILRAVEA